MVPPVLILASGRVRLLHRLDRPAHRRWRRRRRLGPEPRRRPRRLVRRRPGHQPHRRRRPEHPAERHPRSIGGAIIVLLIWNAIRRSRRSRPPRATRRARSLVDGAPPGHACAVASSPPRRPTRSPPTSAPRCRSRCWRPATTWRPPTTSTPWSRRPTASAASRRSTGASCPVWAKDIKTGLKMINARAETVATSDAFKRSLKQRRCIIPVDGFYEWQKRPDTEAQAAVLHPPPRRRAAGLRRAVGDVAGQGGRPRRAVAALVHDHHHDRQRDDGARSTTACR